jgi:SPP1 gp7 family putative phage head morphogenesis protein
MGLRFDDETVVEFYKANLVQTADINLNRFADSIRKAASSAAVNEAQELGLLFDEADLAHAIDERLEEVLTDISDQHRRVVSKAIRESVLTGASERQTIARIAKVVGLDDRYANAVDRYERSLSGDRVSVAKKTKAYADRLRISRATAIARTEANYAANMGRQLVWEQAVSKGYLLGNESRKWIAASDCCDKCKQLHGTLAPLDKAFSNGAFIPPAHPHCRCTTGLVYDEISKAGGRKLGGGRKQQEFARGGLYGTSGKATTVRTAFGPTKRPAAESYETNKAGRPMKAVIDAGELDKAQSTFSQAINPSTGWRMHTSELGDTGERLLLMLSDKPEIKRTLGGGMHHLLTDARDRSRLSRKGEIDLVTKKYALEVKTVNMRGKDPDVNIKPQYAATKITKAKKMKKQGAVVILGYDPEKATLSVFATLDGFQITNSKGERTGRMRPRQLQHVATYSISKKMWDQAQKESGWARDKDGRLTDIYGVSKAMRDHEETYSVSLPKISRNRLSAKGLHGYGVSQETGEDIEPGDHVFRWTGEGFVYFVAGAEDV